MDKHLRFFGIMMAGAGGLTAMLLVLVSVGPLATAFETDGTAGGLLALLLVAAYLAISALMMATGVGLLRFQRWARIAAIGFCLLYVWRFPGWTAASLYGLWVLLSRDGRRLFIT